MAPAYKPVPVAPAIKGLIANTDYASQPKGSYPRLGNFLLGKRGALDTCDGTQPVHAFNGQVQTGRGKFTSVFLFAPTGVSSYYLALLKALDIPLGPPKNLAGTATGGGSLTAGTWVYVVTALDGAGGETSASNEIAVGTGASASVVLTWNVVPNALSYNIYRSNSSGTETLLSGTGLPVPQVSPGTLSVTFTDNGTASPGGVAYNISFAQVGNNQLYIAWTTATPSGLTAGNVFSASGTFGGGLDGSYQVTGIISSTQFITANPNNKPAFTSTLTGTVTPLTHVPTTDSSQQTVLYKMPVIVGSPAVLPVAYNNSNVIALFPADVRVVPAPGGGGGGSGGGGQTGGGGSTGTGNTPSGGVLGNVSFIPQMVAFTNRVAMALGNGFPPQLYSDPSTPTNPATIAAISSISVDAFGVVSVTTSSNHGLTAALTGANVLLSGVTNTAYNGAFTTIQVVDSTHFKVRNLAAIGNASSSGGTSTTTCVPIISTFVPAFPTWSATTSYGVNNIVTPTSSNGHYYTAVQGGVSGSSQPTFPTTTGTEVSDGSIIWKESGLVNSAAPAPPGAGHFYVYAGSLWAFNTSPTNTSTGLDGPCSLRMSDVNNPTSWNPINQAFLDKDDGTEGMGMWSFTIEAQGIPPEGSLVAFKNFSSYQIVGVFGSTNLTIQRVRTDMGCIAPRSIQFVPGFGIARFTHLGFANFDGVEDRVISENIRPFLFPSNDATDNDITVLDANWQSVMWGFQTAQPPMYCAAMPVGSSGGQLTEIACFDLVLKSWAGVIQLPWPISCAGQFRNVGANPVTILAGFSDGLLSRWQAGDPYWDTGAAGARTQSAILWNNKLPEAVSQFLDQKLHCRRVALKGYSSGFGVGKITVIPVVDGVNYTSQQYFIPLVGDWEVFADFFLEGNRFSALVSGTGQIEWNRPTYHVVAKEVGVPRVIS